MARRVRLNPFLLTVWGLALAFAVYLSVWPLVQNEIARHTWTRHACFLDGEGPGRGHYIYGVGNMTYIRGRLSFWDTIHGSEQSVGQLWTGKPNGECWVNPRDPGDAVLHLTGFSDPLVPRALGLSAMVVAVAGLLTWHARRRRAQWVRAGTAAGALASAIGDTSMTHAPASSSAPDTPAASTPTRPLRVLFIASYFPRPTNLLMGTWALQQAQAMQRNGLDVRVVSPTPWVPRWVAVTRGASHFAQCPRRHDFEGLPVEYPRAWYYPVGPCKRWMQRYPGPFLRLEWVSLRQGLVGAVREYQPDVIYAHHTLPNGYLAYRLWKLTGIPYVITDHAFEDITKCAHLPARRRVYGAVARHAHVMIAVSRRMAADRERLFPDARTVVIHNGADPVPPRTEPRPPELQDKLIVLSVGMFYVRKGFPLLVEAFAEVRRRVPNAVLRIVGDGVDRPQVEAAISKHGLGDAVTLLGAQPTSFVAREMGMCDVFALIGWDEPWGVVFSEAFAAGKPVVCCNDGGINDVLVSGVYGLSVPPRDSPATAEAITRLLLDDALRLNMSRACHELFERRLSWDAHCRRLIELLHEACEPHGRSSAGAGGEQPVAVGGAPHIKTV